ncbi:MAG: hypothetical protein NVSMB31_20070 [Vulcanimicrobiaceae bacterium]
MKYLLAAAAALTIAANPLQGSAQDITITAHNFAFSPSVVVLKKGQVVHLHVRATQGVHGLNVPQIGLNNVVLTNSTKIITITPRKTGKFPAHCAVICGIGHAKMEMEFIVK